VTTIAAPFIVGGLALCCAGLLLARLCYRGAKRVRKFTFTTALQGGKGRKKKRRGPRDGKKKKVRFSTVVAQDRMFNSDDVVIEFPSSSPTVGERPERRPTVKDDKPPPPSAEKEKTPPDADADADDTSSSPFDFGSEGDALADLDLGFLDQFDSPTTLAEAAAVSAISDGSPLRLKPLSPKHTSKKKKERKKRRHKPVTANPDGTFTLAAPVERDVNGKRINKKPKKKKIKAKEKKNGSTGGSLLASSSLMMLDHLTNDLEGLSSDTGSESAPASPTRVDIMNE